ncbi:MAG: MFS transporter [Erysipelotrichaceae bacterium]|nr:MFS transporter [Erysipelotrichaceae bacterium]MBQ1346647.1 MFS transporter [Erysipelotrichaceae bacterium]MBQ1379808.1 MFS transporter [Erysipelotrichaceae bacterium]MBQ1625548.1 MFS transporter [Erysipelotrichaceae bacterium]MBQ1692231.1 MFS transporter [Erysipelotrichaceae bacterium]
MEKNNKKTVGLLEKLGFMSFSTSTNIVFNFKSTYYKFFLTSILLIDPIAASNMALISTIWDIANDPLIGVWANNVKFKSGEKVRPWLLYIAVPYALGMVLLFTDFGVSERWDIILGLTVFFFYEIANTFRGIPYNGMGALASANDDDRKSINAFRSLGACLGSGIGAVAVPMIVKAFGGLKDHKVINSSDSPAIFKSALFMGVLIVAGCLIHYFTTKERVRQVSDNEEKIGIIETYRMLFKCKSWVRNMFYVMCYGVSTCLLTSSITYYCAYVLNNSSLSTPIMAAYLVASIVFSIITPRIDSLLGRKKTMGLAALLQVIGKIPFILAPASIINAFINAVFTGMGLTMTFVLFNTNRNSISDIVEVQNGRRLDSMVATGDTLVSKIAEAAVDKLFLVALAAAGFSAKLADEGLLQNAATQNTINALLGWIPALVGLLMFVVCIGIDTDKELKEAIAEKGAIR